MQKDCGMPPCMRVPIDAIDRARDQALAAAEGGNLGAGDFLRNRVEVPATELAPQWLDAACSALRGHVGIDHIVLEAEGGHGKDGGLQVRNHLCFAIREVGRRAKTKSNSQSSGASGPLPRPPSKGAFSRQCLERVGSSSKIGLMP